MPKLRVEGVLKVELGDLIEFISLSKGISYPEAEELLPAWVFEGGYLGVNSIKDNWNTEVIQYLKQNNIRNVEIYQDA